MGGLTGESPRSIHECSLGWPLVFSGEWQLSLFGSGTQEAFVDKAQPLLPSLRLSFTFCSTAVAARHQILKLTRTCLALSSWTWGRLVERSAVLGWLYQLGLPRMQHLVQ